jgi:hypothetical protein
MALTYNLNGSWGSSVNIVPDYRLDNRSSIPGRGCVQTSSEANPAYYPIGTGGPFPRVEAQPGRDTDHSPPSSAVVKNE